MLKQHVSHSGVQEVALTCPACGVSFHTHVWVIVDITERPELVIQMLEEGVHCCACPQGHQGVVQAPLLLVAPSYVQPLLFSPAPSAPPETDRATAKSLVARLYQQPGATWNNEWLTRGVGVVARSQLATILAQLVDDAMQTIREVALIANQSYLDRADPTFLHFAAQQWRLLIATASFSRAPIPFQHTVYNDAGMTFLRLYWEQKKPEDLQESIVLWERAIALLAADAPEMPMYLSNLGNALSSRYARTRDYADLIESIRLSRRAVAQTPLNAPFRSLCLNNLAVGLLERYEHDANERDLNTALECFRELQATTPSTSSDFVSYLTNLGACLYQRYLLHGNIADVDEAISVYRQVLDLPVSEPTEQLSPLNNLGAALHRRYQRLGQPLDLQEAVGAFRAAHHALPSDSPRQGTYLTNLGLALCDYHQLLGNRTALDEAIVAFRRAIAAVPPSTIEHTLYMANLGMGIAYRYEYDGQDVDGHESIEIYQAVVAATPVTSPLLSSHLTNLATTLRARYLRHKDKNDLNAAVQFFRQAVACTPIASPGLSACYNNLAGVLIARYEISRQPDDLAEAIKLYRSIVEPILPPVPLVATYLTNLGVGLAYYCYRETQNVTDLKAGIRFYRKAVRYVPKHTPNHVLCLHNLGTGLSDLSTISRNPKDAHAAQKLLKQACELGLELNVAVALKAARRWGDDAFGQGLWDEATTAYAYGREASARWYLRHVMRPDKEQGLREARHLYTYCAYALARKGDFIGAVEVVEQGRARILGEVLARDRAELTTVQSALPTEYSRYQEAVALLRQTEQDLSYSRNRQEAAQIARDQLDSAIAAIRTLPQFSTFLKVPDFAEIDLAVQAEVPLLYLLATSRGTLVLLLHRPVPNAPLEIDPLWCNALDEMTLRVWMFGPDDTPELGGWLGVYHQWQTNPAHTDARERWFARIEEVTRQLWDTVMSIVVKRLKLLGVQRAILVPTGLFAFLPLHATWTEQNGQRVYALDTVALSYTPSARALIHARGRVSQNAPQRVVLVDNPQPTFGADLPYSAAEVAGVMAHFPLARVLRHEQATRDVVLDALSTTTLAHLSCHGVTQWINPLQSGLLMAHNEVLTVQDLASLRLEGSRLATLSACETGLVGMKLPDEMVGLPTAFLQAGFAGVIASLWAVADVSTAMLMLYFYHLWQEERLEPAVALQQAQQWLRDRTNAERVAFFREAMESGGVQSRLPPKIARTFFHHSFVYELASRQYEHPFWWAAFYLTGV